MHGVKISKSSNFTHSKSSLLKIIAGYQYMVGNAKRIVFGSPEDFYYSAVEPKSLGSESLFSML